MDDTPEAPVEVEADEIAAFRWQAEEASDAGRHADALPFLTRWIELAPDDPEPVLLRAWEHFWNHDPAAARADADQAAARFLDSARVAVEVGELYDEMDAVEEADAAYTRAETLIGDDADLLLRLANDYEEIEDYEKALVVFERLAKVNPYSGLRGKSRVRRALGDPQAALRDLDAARAAYPADDEDPNQVLAWMWNERASILRELGDWDGVEEAARTVLSLTGDKMLISEALTTVGDVARERGDLTAARAALEDAIARDPQYWPAWQQLIVIAMDDSDEQTVLDLLHRAQEHMPTNYSLVSIAGMLQLRMGNANGILDEWDRLIAAHPDDAQALATRAGLHLGMEHYDEARADATRALQIESDNPIALEVQAKLLAEDGDFRGALAAVNQALRGRPDDPELLLLRARLHMQLGNQVGAAADYARVIALEPDNALAHAGLGNVQMVLGQYDGALQSYQTVLRLVPDAPAAFYNLAAAHAALGQCNQALAYLRRGVAGDPTLAPEAADDPSFEACSGYPGFAAALRGEPAPTSPPGKGKKGKPQGRPPRSQRRK